MKTKILVNVNAQVEIEPNTLTYKEIEVLDSMLNNKKPLNLSNISELQWTPEESAVMLKIAFALSRVDMKNETHPQTLELQSYTVEQ